MAGRVTDAGAAHLVLEEGLLRIRVLVRENRAERGGPCMAVETRPYVERTHELDRKRVVVRRRAEHVPDAGHLGVDGAPDAVSTVAYEARLLVRDQTTAVVDGGERIALLAEAGRDRRHDVTRAAEGDRLRVVHDEQGAERVGCDGEE